MTQTNRTRKTIITTVVLALLMTATGFSDATVTDGILSVSPSFATQGVTGLTVTFNLSSNSVPPLPPASTLPTSAMIGTNSGTSLARPSQYVATAVFTIAGPIGTNDVAVSLPFVGGTLTYNRTNAFQIIAASLTANFTATPTYGTPPLTVTFTDASTGTITNRLWNFGDSITSTNTNPTHTYSNAANYTVSLSVFGNSGSNTLTRASHITVTTNGGNYLIADTGQTTCYDITSAITAPAAGQPYYGQDAQFFGNQTSYSLSGDSKTVYDNNTGLTWMRSPNMTLTPPVKTDRMIFTAIPSWVATVNAANWGGYNDWRLPALKELYSLYIGAGTDLSGFSGDTSVLTPFIDNSYFLFAYGNTNLGERLIDQQYASSTTFILNPSESGYQKDFGVNFSDGRIKGYDETDTLSGQLKTFYVQLVRGGTGYAINNFNNNSDGTTTDRSTGLMWSRIDNGLGVIWSNALAWVQTKNTANYLGYNDWRLPNVKELQSIVNYANAPDYNSLPAIDTNYFTSTVITNEAGQLDYPYYWSSTTHAAYSTSNTGGGDADYVAFGRALGWPTNQWVDVHGAGAQRSDPKNGYLASPPYTKYTVITNGTTYVGYSFGPQGDAIRGSNFVRLVRSGYSSTVDHVGDGIPDCWRRQYFGGSGTTTNASSCATCDADVTGQNNRFKYTADLNPTNRSSRLAIINIARLTNDIHLTWIGGNNATQTLECTSSLLSNQWSAIYTNTPLPTPTTNALIHTGATTATNLFYRIKSWR